MTKRKLASRVVNVVLALVLAMNALMVLDTERSVRAAGGLTLTIIAAPNLVVDSNALSPSTYAPKVATVIAKICNTGDAPVSGVTAYIGDYTGSGAVLGTPGVYPVRTDPLVGGLQYQGSYSFTHLGGAVDAARYMGTLAAGECRYQYWSFEYPHYAYTGGQKIPTWGLSVKPDDDLWLTFDMWVRGDSDNNGTLDLTTSGEHTMTMRNEISAMANKIKPNGNPAGQWFNTDTSIVYPGETVTTNGILYRLGNVNQGFDNDGDGAPDYNAWLQPFGDPAYDPSCFRLIEVTGVLTVTRGSGNPDLIIPIYNNLYFTNLPPDNTDVRGLVYYTFLALGGACVVPISPYQEVASGSDNEKFNGDYGTGVPGLMSYQPEVTVNKTGPGMIGKPASGYNTLTYTIPFYNTSTQASAGLTLSSGGAVDMPMVIEDTVPEGLKYICGQTSATLNYDPYPTQDPNPDLGYKVLYSTDSGLTWSESEPACTGTTPVSTGPDNLIKIRWVLTTPLPKKTGITPPGGVATFQAGILSTYSGASFIDNCADGKFGYDSPAFASTCTTTMVRGTNSIGDFIWKDQDGDGMQDGGAAEPGLSGVTVKLYWDKNSNGTLDAGEPQVNLVKVNVIDGKLDLDGNGTADDNGEFDAYNVIGGAIDVNGDGSITDEDDGTAVINGYNIINGYLDMDEDDSTSLPDGDDDGQVTSTMTQSQSATITAGVSSVTGGPTNVFAGYNLIGGLVDVNGDGVINTSDTGTNLIGGYNSYGGANTVVLYNVTNGYVTSGGVNVANATLSGTYGFAYLPDAQYIVEVVAADYDVTTGYTPTTPKQYVVNLTGGTNNRTSDFGFGPTLAVNKYLASADPPYVGEEVTFHIDLYNTLPGDGTAGGFCQYTIWATAAGTNDNGSGWQNKPGAYSSVNGPDANYAYLLPTSNVDRISAGGVTYGFPAGTTFRKVEAIYSLYIEGQFADDSLRADFWRGATQYRQATDIAIATINSYGPGRGKQAIYAWDITTGYGTWATTDFNGTTLQVGFDGQKAGGAQGDTIIRIDAMGFRVTTDQICGGADTTIAVLPLEDTYDADLLQFLYADPPVSSATTSGSAPNTVGTLTWDNLGPLYAGGTRTVKVTFRALATVASPGTTNTGSVTDAKFANGRDVNDDDDDATVTINASGSIAGTVWADGGTTTGWANPNGYDGSDTFIPNVKVELYGCYSKITGQLLTPATASSTGKDCADSANNGEWRLVATDYTDGSGNYAFTGLRDGYYNVEINDGSTPTGFPTRRAEPNPAGNGSGFTCGTCDGLWNSWTADLSTFNDLNNSGGGENINRVNFGYINAGVGAVVGYLWHDVDADGVWDADEQPIAGVSVSLTCSGSGCPGSISPVTTGANGYYQFTGLPVSNASYVVVVTPPSAMSQSGDPDVPGSPCGGSCDDQKSSFTLMAGQVTGPYNFGYTGGLTIGDTVYTDWNGDGDQDSGDAGIENVVVYLYRDVNGNDAVDLGIDILLGSETTDASGYYEFTNLPGNGTQYIVVVGQSSLPAGYTQTGDPDESGTCSTCDSKDPLTLSTSSYLSADFGYQPRGQGMIGDTVWLDTNGNGVQNTGETGQPNVTVNLYYDTDGDGVIDSATDPLVATTTTLGYTVIDGYIDVSGNGSIGAEDALASLYGYRIIAGAIDIDGSNSIDTTDDGFSGPYRVVDGRLDMNGDGSATTADDGDLKGFYLFQNLPAGDFIVQVAPAELTTGGDLAGLTMTNTGTEYDAGQVSRSVALSGGQKFFDADFGFASSAIGDLIWQDNNGDGIWQSNEPGIPGVLVELYLDADNDGVADGAAIRSMQTLYNIINGYLDVDRDGVTDGDTGDTGTITLNGLSYTITNGRLDINRSGGIDGNDDGIFAGYTVIDGYFDVDGDGVVAGDTGDDAASLGTYLFDGLSADNYIVQVATGNFDSGGPLYNYTLTADPNSYNTLTPTNLSCTAPGAQECDGVNWLKGITVSGVFFPGLQLGQNDLSSDFGYKPPTRTIGDTVWIDGNGNNVRDAGEKGIPYITVQLCADSGCSTVLQTTATDENGDYTFSGLANDTTYYVKVLATTDPDFPAGLTPTYDLDGTGTPHITAVAVGTTDRYDVDFGYRFYGNNSISGTAWYDADQGGQSSGIGDIDTGETVRYGNVPLYLWRCVNGCGGVDDILVAVTTTAANGTYAFNNLSDGDYRVALDGKAPEVNGLTSTTGTSYSPVTLSGSTAAQRDFGFYAALDYGDLPDFYGTTAAAGGAGHIFNAAWGTLYLGDARYTEADGQPTTDATGDGDEEDGVQLRAGQVFRAGSTLTFDVTITGSNGYLVAFFDWNGDGDFADAGEVINFANRAAGTHALTVNVPAGADSGSLLNARFRLYDVTLMSSFASEGMAKNGEVEDYQWKLGAIGDYVWLDLDRDGFQDISEPGLANVKVNLYQSDGTTLLASTYTNGDGLYRFENLVAGNYVVKVDTTTLPNGGTNIVNTYDPDQAGGGDSSSGVLALAAGQSLSTADFGYAPNATKAAIGDYIWSDADNDGIQDPGEPGIQGVTVALKSAGADGIFGTADDMTVATTTTDAAGRYLFTNIDPGEYSVDVTDTGGKLSGYTLKVGPQSSTDPTAPIKVRAGDVYLDADFGYYKSDLGAISNQVWLDFNGNGYFDGGESGLSGVKVSLVKDSDGDGIWDAGEPIIATAVTAADGSYAFNGLLLDYGSGNAKYLVVVDDTNIALRDYIKTTGSNTTADNYSKGEPYAVTLSSGTTSNVTADFGYRYPLGVNGMIGDRVWYDLDGDGVQDSGEVGIAGVTVYLCASSPCGSSNAIRTTTTDVNGHYYFTNLSAGTYYVAVNTSTLNGGVTVNTFDDDGDYDSDSGAIVLSEGQTYLDADFGYNYAGTTYSIGDKVWRDDNANGRDDESTTGIAGVTLALYKDSDGDGILDPGEPLLATTTTDSDGAYTFGGLPAGNYIVDVTDEYGKLVGYRQTAGNDPWPVTITTANRNDIDFSYVRAAGLGSIGDTIWYDDNGDGKQDPVEKGIPGVTVQLWKYVDSDSDGIPDTYTQVATTVTGHDGSYRFLNLPAGIYEVRVTAPAGTTQTGDPDASVDNKTTVALSEGEIFMTADFGYRGSGYSIGDYVWADADADGIQDPGEPGIAGVLVELFNASGVSQGTTTTNAYGYYRFTGLSAGSYYVTVLSSNFAAGGALYGYGPSPTGGPESQVNNTSDLYALSDTRPSVDKVDFGYDNSSLGSIGDFVWLDYDKDGNQDTGEPGLKGIYVDLIYNGNVIATTVTDANGNYTFTGLKYGDYTVRVEDRDNVLQGMTLTTAGSFDRTVSAGTPNHTDADFGFNDPTVGDFVWLDADGDGIQDATESGIQGVKVLLYRDFDGDGVIDPGVDNLIMTRFTNENGYYYFGDLPLNTTYIIKLEDSNFAAGGVLEGFKTTLQNQGSDDKDSDAVANLTTGVQIAITTPGLQAEDFTFDFGLVCAENCRTIGNQVWYDENANGYRDSGAERDNGGIPNVTLVLYRDLDGNGVIDPDDPVMGKTTTASDGTYSFTNLPPDRYIVQVTDENFALKGYLWSDNGTPDTNDYSQVTTYAVNATTGNVDYADFGFKPGNPPTAVTLVSFTAVPEGQAIRLAWETASELNNVGFNLYRSESPDGPYAPVNAMLIPPQNPGSVLGAVYEWMDTDVQAGVTYYYKLEDLDLDGTCTLHGPVTATAQAAMSAPRYELFLPLVFARP